jgi:hypothetical protein
MVVSWISSRILSSVVHVRRAQDQEIDPFRSAGHVTRDRQPRLKEKVSAARGLDTGIAVERREILRRGIEVSERENMTRSDPRVTAILGAIDFHSLMRAASELQTNGPKQTAMLGNGSEKHRRGSVQLRPCNAVR